MKARRPLSGLLVLGALALILILPLPLPLAHVQAGPWDPTVADSLNVTILGHFSVDSPVGIWGCAGYTDEGTGEEFALLGADSLYVIDVSDPMNPARAAAFPVATPPGDNYYVHVSVWEHYAYAAGRYGPILILDLTDPAAPDSVGAIPASEFCACFHDHPCDPSTLPHPCLPDSVPPLPEYQPRIETLFIDERGILFVSGIECGKGIHMYDLAANPANPPWLCHEFTQPDDCPGGDRYAHDVHVRDGIMYVSRSRFPLSRWDMIDVGGSVCPNPDPGNCGNGHELLSWFTHSLDAPCQPNEDSVHAHSSWLVEDTPFLLTADEIAYGHVRVWDVSDLEAPVQVGRYHPDETCHSIHNVYATRDSTYGDLCYAAWYNKGIQIFKLTESGRPYRVGYYEHPVRWKAGPEDPCCNVDENCRGIPYLDPFFPSGIFIASEAGGGLLTGRVLRDPSAVSEGLEEVSSSRAGELRVLGLPGRSFKILWRRETGRLGPETAEAGLLEIYSPAGRTVQVLRPGAGSTDDLFEYSWHGEDRRGGRLPSGVYFVKPGRGETQGTKIILLD